MRPEFGCRLADYVFAPANATTAGQLANEVRAALERWEPRIDVGDVDIGFDAAGSGIVYIDVHYQIRGDNDPRNLVFPFYVIPEEQPGELTAASGECMTMPLPAPNLDDRHFQDLVDDAKRLVQQRCPEWTDHNVSDPGVTLIEAFAQMVDQLIYRLNRVPDRHYVKFLDLLGVQLFPPTAATGTVTFWLSAPQPHAVVVRAETEVATPRTDIEEPVVFATTAELQIVPCELRRVATQPAAQDAVGPDQHGWRTGSCRASPTCPGRRRAAHRAVRRRAVLRGAAAVRLPGPRRRHRPAEPAADLGGVERRGLEPRARSSTTTRAASTARATSSCTCPPPTGPRSSPGSGPAGCAAGSCGRTADQPAYTRDAR